MKGCRLRPKYKRRPSWIPRIAASTTGNPDFRLVELRKPAVVELPQMRVLTPARGLPCRQAAGGLPLATFVRWCWRSLPPDAMMAAPFRLRLRNRSPAPSLRLSPGHHRLDGPAALRRDRGPERAAASDGDDRADRDLFVPDQHARTNGVRVGHADEGRLCTFNPSVVNLNGITGSRTVNFTGMGASCVGVAQATAVDPGPRGGPPGAGAPRTPQPINPDDPAAQAQAGVACLSTASDTTPAPGLSPALKIACEQTVIRFQEVDSVSGTLPGEEGVGLGADLQREQLRDVPFRARRPRNQPGSEQQDRSDAQPAGRARDAGRGAQRGPGVHHHGRSRA